MAGINYPAPQATLEPGTVSIAAGNSHRDVLGWNDVNYDSGMAIAGAKIGDVVIAPPPAAVPLPASLLLLGGGIGALGAMRCRKAGAA